MKSILALDLGTKMGWAVHYNGKIESGSSRLKNSRFEGAGVRYNVLYHWLGKSHKKYKFDELYFEEVRCRQPSVAADHAYGGYSGVAMMWCEENNVPYGGIPLGTIKKYITGAGNANKKGVIEAVRRRGYNPIDDNEADALALLLLKMEDE